jgi:hypothetical protein
LGLLHASGLAGRERPTSAAIAVDATKADDKTMAIKVRMVFLVHLFFCNYTPKCNRHNHGQAKAAALQSRRTRKWPAVKGLVAAVALISHPRGCAPPSGRLDAENPAHARAILVGPAGVMAGVAADEGAL